MDEQQVTSLTLSEVAASIHAGELSSREVVDACLQRIERLNPTLNAFLTILGDEARAAADQADQARASGQPLGSLHGVPLGVKDLIDVAGVKTTAGSDFLRENVAQQDARVVEKLRTAGAIIIGKNHLHEFAIGATTVNPHYGPARNPWNTGYSPGGSSGGSSSAVSAGLIPGSLGTDTGGSVRMPAALCNLTGLRPALGRVSTTGVVPMSHSLDTIGPIVPTAADAALLMDVIAEQPTDCMESLDAPVKGLRIALIEEDFIWSKTESDIAAAVRESLSVFADLGLAVSEAPFPLMSDAQRGGGTISLCDALLYHKDWLENEPERYGEDVRGRLEWAQKRTGYHYAWARQVSRDARAYLDDLFTRVDILALPTAPQSRHKIEGSEGISAARDMLTLTYPFSMVGLPSMSIPCGFTTDGFPIGLQMVALKEATLTQVGHAFQQAADWHTRRPSIE